MITHNAMEKRENRYQYGGDFFIARKERDMWKPVVGYEGLYEVSDQGEVRRILKDGRTRPMKIYKGNKYHTVCLCKNGVGTTSNVHRLVAEAFIGKSEKKKEINHKDGNKHNNRADNLEWVTQRENLIHAMETLNHFPYGKPARKVRCINPNTNEIIAEFPSLASAAKAVGKISARASITHVCQGYQGQAYGFKWEYAD